VQRDRSDRLDQAYPLFTKAAGSEQALLQPAISFTQSGVSDTMRLTEILSMKTSVPDFTLTTFKMDPIGPADDPSHFRWEP
jgi:hypothetical protein